MDGKGCEEKLLKQYYLKENQMDKKVIKLHKVKENWGAEEVIGEEKNELWL